MDTSNAPTWQADGKLVVPPERGVANEFASIGMGRPDRDGSPTGGEPAAPQNSLLLHHEGGRHPEEVISKKTTSDLLYRHYSTAADTPADRTRLENTLTLSPSVTHCSSPALPLPLSL